MAISGAGLMVLHWGQVEQFIEVIGVDSKDGVIRPGVKSGVIVAKRGSGAIKVLSGSGGSKKVGS